jgi:hypothetical protein
MGNLMNFSRRLAAFLVLLASLFVTGCASVAMTSQIDDAKAKSFAVRPDKANIYVYRNETFGAAVPMTVTLNGKVAGQTASKTYFLFEVDPGAHEVGSIAENVAALKLSVVPGKSYFVWQEVKMGLWMARTQLQEVDEATGRGAVAQCMRAQSSF